MKECKPKPRAGSSPAAVLVAANAFVAPSFAEEGFQLDAALLAVAALVRTQTASKRERRACRKSLKASRTGLRRLEPVPPIMRDEAIRCIERACGACGLCGGI